MKRILVADSDGQTRLGMKLFLKRKGYEVEEAINAEEALLKLRIRTYALAFLDPDMSIPAGPKVLTQLPPELFDATPVVVIASEKKDNDVMKAYAMGAAYYLKKPVSVDRILDITEYLTGDIHAQKKRELSARL